MNYIPYSLGKTVCLVKHLNTCKHILIIGLYFEIAQIRLNIEQLKRSIENFVIFPKLSVYTKGLVIIYREGGGGGAGGNKGGGPQNFVH